MTQILKAHSHSTFLVAPNPLKETQILIALFESTLIAPIPLKSFTAARKASRVPKMLFPGTRSTDASLRENPDEKYLFIMENDFPKHFETRNF